MAASTRPVDRPGAAVIAALIISVLGLAISTYLTIEHYSSSSLLACPESATINCVKVTTSRWSVIAGVPIAVLGLLYFVAMTALLVPAAWQRPQLDRVRVAGVGLGAAMVLYLVYVELFEVDAICLWCTGVHVCVIALFGVVLWQTSSVGEPLTESRQSPRGPR